MKELPKELEIYSPEETEDETVYEMVPTGTEKAVICVSDELLEHYQAVIKARDEVLDNSESSGGEKAAILNATTSILKDLLKLMAAANSADTVARLQQAVFNALSEASPDLKDKVLTLLEKNLEEV